MSIKQSIKKYGYAEISSGTLRPQDLIPAYLGALRELAPEAYQQPTWKNHRLTISLQSRLRVPLMLV